MSTVLGLVALLRESSETCPFPELQTFSRLRLNGIVTVPGNSAVETPSSIDGVRKRRQPYFETLGSTNDSRKVVTAERVEEDRRSHVRLPPPVVDAPRDWIFGRCSNPLAQRVSSPGTFTRSLAYHTSDGARGLNPRPITIHFGLSAGSSSPRNPFPLRAVLQFAFGLPPRGPFICLSNGRTAQSVPPLATPFFLPPSAALARTHADPLLLRLRKSRDPWDPTTACPSPSHSSRFLPIFPPLPTATNQDFLHANKAKVYSARTVRQSQRVN